MWISNHGRFRDCNKKDVKLRVNGKGYYVLLTDEGSYLAHRLVLETWRPIENMGDMTVDHLDQNKRNIGVDNLEWVTEAENKHRAESNAYDSQEDDKFQVRNIVAVTWCGVTMTVQQFIDMNYQLNSHGMDKKKYVEQTMSRIRNRAPKIHGHEVTYIMKKEM
jgi:hypothetical protein